MVKAILAQVGVSYSELSVSTTQSQDGQTLFRVMAGAYAVRDGSPLRRKVWNSKTPFKKYVWQCSNYINKSKRTCTGTKIDEKELEKINIDGPIIIGEVLRDGKKYYSYTSNRE